MFANGNIQFLGDLEKCLEFTRVDGIMSAEGSLYNPAIFMDPAAPFEERHPRIDRLAREYLKIVRELNDPLSNVVIKPHLFKIFRAALEVHTDIRNLLGVSRGSEDYEKVISMLEERIEKELQENPEVESGTVPWYRCQPYLRSERAVDAKKENGTDKIMEVKVETQVSA